MAVNIALIVDLSGPVVKVVKKMQNEFTLKNKLIIIGSSLLVLAMISISFTLWVTWKLDGGAAAINEAGRMRMQTYQLTLLINENNSRLVTQLEQKFDDSMQVLRLGDPSRPLFVPWNQANTEVFSSIQAQWANIKNGLTLQQADVLSMQNIDKFISSIDHFVGLIEGEVDYWTGLLHLFQFAMLAISLVATLVIMYVGYSVILDPVAKLRIGFDEVKLGKLKTHVQIDAQDEFGDLAKGFNAMTENLNDLYESLEAKVREKTIHLQERQERLAALYDLSSFVSSENNLENLAKGFADRVSLISHAAAIAIRWTDEANKRYFLLSGTNLPDSILAGEQCMNAGECHCGNATGIQDIKVIKFNLHEERDRLCVKAGFQSLITVPILFQQKLLGEIDLFYAESFMIDQEQHALLETLANHLAGAMEALRIKALEKEAAISDERSLLARELHDSIAQSLAFLKIQASLLRDEISALQMPNVKAILNELDEGLRESYSDVRELLLHYRTRTNIEDIESAIKTTLQKFEHQFGIKVNLIMHGQGLPLAPDVQIQVLHIIQEALSNIRKHAKAETVTLTVQQNPIWSFEVVDDGIGFLIDLDKLDSTHVGVSIMRERASKINAEVTISSTPNGGSRVFLRLPNLASMSA